MRLRALVLVSAALLAAGCGQPPAAPVQAAAPRDLAEAVDAMARRDYAGAAATLRRLLERSPDHFEAHYRLGVSASYLDLVEEATREFEWVVGHGAPDSPEVRIARNWLASRARRQPDAAADTATRPEPDPTRASLSGRVTWEEGGVVQPRPWVRLFLQGVKGTPVEDEFFRVQTDREGAYQITGIPPGDYRLTDRGSGTTSWRLKVTLKAGQSAVLDLSPANSVKVRDDFPESTGS